MRESDLDFAAESAALEGWTSETRDAFAAAHDYDPAGAVIAELDGRPVGIVVAVGYGRSGFIGELIVRREARGRGIGPKLFERALQYLKERGAEAIGLDAVERAVPFYEAMGFRAVCRSLRFLGKVEGRRLPGVRPMRREDLSEVLRLDRAAFGDDRSFYLERRFSLYPRFAKVAEREGGLAGFILGMKGRGVVAAGPWIQRDEAEGENPLALLEGLAAETEGLPLRVGVLETNARAAAALRSCPGLAVARPSLRMVLLNAADGGAVVAGDSPGPRVPPTLGFSPLCWAVGSPAKG
jgi:GNAT superfamily N-acetyltransferase